MSQLRRLNQIKRTMPSFSAKVAVVVRTHWEKFLGIIGVPTLFDLVREFAREKTMEWIYQNLGTFGSWLASYKLAGLTVGLVAVIVWITIAVVREAKERESVILDPEGRPYTFRTVSRAQATGAIAAAAACIILLFYGSYTFYRVSPSVLLDKYPLGYIMFDVDRTNNVFPLSSREVLDKWDFDWSVVQIANRGSEVNLVFPNIKPKGSNNWKFYNNSIVFPKKTGPFPYQLVGSSNFILKGEILSIDKRATIFVLGFARP